MEHFLGSYKSPKTWKKNGKERNIPFKERNVPNGKEGGAQPWKKRPRPATKLLLGSLIKA